MRAAALSFLLTGLLYGQSQFTLDQVLSSPFVEGLVASPRHDAVAWLQAAQGVRNVWVARAPGYTASAITRFIQDDGQEITDISWAADDSAVVFTRGGDANGRGEIPNPLNLPSGVKQEVWMAPISGTPRKLGDGHSPAIAPDGSVVAWISSGQVWSVALSAEAKPAQLIHARGRAGSLAWAPDGSHLAFISNRGDHAFVATYSVLGKSLSFLDTSVDVDQSPVWSPDSSQIAFIRIPTNRYAAAWGPKRTAEPWSIRVADARTGKGREVFHAAPGTGSRFWAMSAENQLLWADGNRLVFPWEGDGWLHLYSVPTAGGQPVLLTAGNFEIEHVALSADRRSVVYSSNNGDADRRHLWNVPVTGGTQKPLTPGTGIEWSPAPLADGRLALLHADARGPSRAALMEAAGTLRELAAATMPADFPAARLVDPQPVLFPAADGLQLHGQVFLPPNPGSGKHPAVIFFHGGSRREMLLGWHHMFYYHQAYAFNQYLASKGYVVLSVNYRSGVGYGMQFREAPNYGATGGSEYNDVIGAGLYLRSRPDVDPARVGLWGGSYGGYLTAMGLARASDLFAVGVDLHGVHEWNLEINNSLAPGWKPEERVEVARIAHESSPMAYIQTWRSPVLLIQGDDDRNVEFSNTVQLAEALRKQGVPFEQLIFPDEVHDFLVHRHWLAAYKAADEFLARYLKP